MVCSWQPGSITLGLHNVRDKTATECWVFMPSSTLERKTSGH